MSSPVSAQELIDRAESLLNPVVVRDRLFGDVASTLVTDRGNVYSGVCVDTPTWGLCAERSAIAAMVTAGEYRIARIVAVWRERPDAALHVLPPCGTCREFIRQIHPDNLDTEVILGLGESARLGELLPFHAWPEPIDRRTGPPRSR